MNKVKLWEQQDGESEPAFAAFKHYRDAGASRSYAKTAEKLEKSKTLIERWAFAHKWPHRIRAFNRELDAEARRDRRRSYNEMFERHSTVGQMLVNRATKALAGKDWSKMSVLELVRAIKLGVQIEHDARGFNIHEVVRTPADLAHDTASKIINISGGEKDDASNG
ncbi:MAG: hypothetical protein EOO38_17015 [Cytophagaceae bacterium]|nr:MAG: hypothetical protein EOO38_17015 [Cytophagaceae bacterium]